MNRIERVLRAIDRFQQRHGLLGFPIGVAKKFGDDGGSKHAALLAYYGFFSLFPLLLVFTTVIGYALANDAELRQSVIDTAIAQFPVLGPQLQGSIETIQGSGVGLVIGIVGTLWAGLGITRSAQDAMNSSGSWAYASVAAASAPQPIQPPPPARFSTVTDLPSTCSRSFASMRAVMSVPPPAP